MAETALADLALQIARLEGKLDGYQQTVKLEMISFERRLQELVDDRLSLRRAVDSLLVWRAWITGIGAGVGVIATVLGVYATLHAVGVHP